MTNPAYTDQVRRVLGQLLRNGYRKGTQIRKSLIMKNTHFRASELDRILDDIVSKGLIAVGNFGDNARTVHVVLLVSQADIRKAIIDISSTTPKAEPTGTEVKQCIESGRRKYHLSDLLGMCGEPEAVEAQRTPNSEWQNILSFHVPSKGKRKAIMFLSSQFGLDVSPHPSFESDIMVDMHPDDYEKVTGFPVWTE